MAFNLLKKLYPTHRFKAVFLNLLNNLLVPLFNVVISAFIVRYLSLSFWGEYSRLILFTSVLTQFSLWGNKDYLLREFSKYPAAIVATWQESSSARTFIMLVSGAMLFFLVPPSTAALLCAILVTRSYYLSYDPIITYTGRFALKTFAEITGTVGLLVLLVVYGSDLTIQRFIAFSLIGEMVKLSILLKSLNRHYPLPFRFELNKQYLLASSGFLFLSFSGFFAYKADQLFAAIFLSHEVFASYQLLLGFLLVIHAFAGYIIQPFLKIIYRSKITLVNKLSLKLLLNGTWICVIGIIAIKWALHIIYGINMETNVFVAAWLFIIPPFYYAPYLFYSFILNKQVAVALINFSGAIVTFVLCLVLRLFTEPGLAIVLSAAAISQWLMLIAFVIMNKQGMKQTGTVL